MVLFPWFPMSLFIDLSKIYIDKVIVPVVSLTCFKSIQYIVATLLVNENT